MGQKDKQRIGIIGSGIVGKTLAAGFDHKGRDVMIASRRPTKLVDRQQDTSASIELGDFAEVAAFGSLLVLAVKGAAAKEALALIGADKLVGKTIIDTTNPIQDAPPAEHGVLEFFTDQNSSLMEALQASFPEAHFVKCFSCIGAHLMVDPDLGGERPTMFICGNDDASKAQIGEIVDQFGFEVADMGSVEAARAIEPLCKLWCIPGFRAEQWVHAFRLLRG